MTVEIIKDGPVFGDKNGKKWIPVIISQDAVGQLNKIVLGDKVDQGDKDKVRLREQVHKDCLELLEEFTQ